MDKQFQDHIDDYLLGRMDEVDKEAFLNEVAQDAEKRSQLEFTRRVMETVESRQKKLKAMALFQQQIETKRRTDRIKNRALLGLGVVAMMVAIFFCVKPMLKSTDSDAAEETVRGDDDVFCPAESDTARLDTIQVSGLAR